MESGLKALSIEEFKKLIRTTIRFVLIPARQQNLRKGMPGSISIGLDGRFAEWAASLLPFDKPIVLVTDPGKEKESLVRLARVGFSQMCGYLDGGFEKWKSAGERIDLVVNIDADEFAMDLPFDPKLRVVDVRRETEFARRPCSGSKKYSAGNIN